MALHYNIEYIWWHRYEISKLYLLLSIDSALPVIICYLLWNQIASNFIMFLINKFYALNNCIRSGRKSNVYKTVNLLKQALNVDNVMLMQLTPKSCQPKLKINSAFSHQVFNLCLLYYSFLSCFNELDYVFKRFCLLKIEFNHLLVY